MCCGDGGSVFGGNFGVGGNGNTAYNSTITVEGGKIVDVIYVEDEGFDYKMDALKVRYPDIETIEELADIYELIRTIAELHDSSMENVARLANKKKKERGAFEKKIFLEKVIEE